MRNHLLLGLLVATGCVGAAPEGGGDDDVLPDDGDLARTCPLPDTTADAGDLTALKAEMCNVNGSQGALKWYRLSATLADTGDVVQLELWPGTGAFAGGAVTTGTFPIEADYNTCGVCLRGIGDKGAEGVKEFLGMGGSVEITAVGAAGAPISATITNAMMVEVNIKTHLPVEMGCTAAIDRVKLSGTVVAIGGTGGGGGGGGGGGTGTECAVGVGD